MAGRLTIIGGGVMGLMTAYQAAPPAESVALDPFTCTRFEMAQFAPQARELGVFRADVAAKDAAFLHSWTA